jgi:hypothetical protein
MKSAAPNLDAITGQQKFTLFCLQQRLAPYRPGACWVGRERNAPDWRTQQATNCASRRWHALYSRAVQQFMQVKRQTYKAGVFFTWSSQALEGVGNGFKQTTRWMLLSLKNRGSVITSAKRRFCVGDDFRTGGKVDK